MSVQSSHSNSAGNVEKGADQPDDDGRGSEPADPQKSEFDLDTRDRIFIAPLDYAEDLPAPLCRCGCGECPDSWHPLAEEQSRKLAGRRCSNPLPVSIGTARKIYVKYTRSRWRSTDTSKYERHKKRYYPGILEADRIFRYLYDLTTVMLTRRVSPLSEKCNLLTPVELDQRLNGGNVRDRMMKSIRYHLKDFSWSYFSVTAPTESFGTPHEHLYIYIDDPDNEITPSQFVPALEKHLDACKGAYRRHHQYDKDGEHGSITVRHDPPLVDETPEKVDSIRESCTAIQICSDEFLRNTQGAQYIATQLPHLHIGDKFNGDQPNPKRTLLDGGVTAWISDYNWFRRSRDFPLPDW